MRLGDLLAIATLTTLAANGACTPTERVSTSGGAGTSGAAGTSVTGVAGTSGAAGSSSSTGAAGTSSTGGSTNIPSGVDDGRLFRDAAVLPAVDSTPTVDAGRADAAAPMATATLRIGGLGLTAVFTQKGTDVTMSVTATNCAQGMHVIEIHGGFSCDNSGTQGPVWDGKRGAGIPALNCGADRKGTMTYTRSAADPATAWTVGDHATKTDVTLHPAIASGNCGTFF
jgi:hypothetical protein